MRRSGPTRLETLPRRKAEFIEPMGCLPVTKLNDAVQWTYEILCGLRCTRDTTPLDWTGAGNYWVTTEPPLIPTQVVDGKTICVRVGTSGPWTCLPVGKFTGGSWNLPWPLGF